MYSAESVTVNEDDELLFKDFMSFQYCEVFQVTEIKNGQIYKTKSIGFCRSIYDASLHAQVMCGSTIYKLASLSKEQTDYTDRDGKVRLSPVVEFISLSEIKSHDAH